ncbi:hypothetical protein [Labrenzia sp. VG12]|uniref:hypothetical protein n=1 Tax=Labrenzia sp. VG12 TaxID=2021862 RepID=UPI0012FDAF6D|nr:hypothetical protein [Labrenzia sp. VG12]
MNCFFKVINIAFYSYLIAVGATEAGEKLLPPQLNNRTCQSFALAVALQSEEDKKQIVVDDTINLELFQSIQRKESAIRDLVVRRMKSKGQKSSTREDWDYVVRLYTGGKYRVQTRYYYGQPKLLSAIREHFFPREECIKRNAYCSDSRRGNEPVLNEERGARYLLTSVSYIDGRTYNSGHVVTLAGMTELPILDSEKTPQLKVINSYYSGGASQVCVNPRTQIHWTNEFKLKFLWHVFDRRSKYFTKMKRKKIPVLSISWVEATF